MLRAEPIVAWRAWRAAERTSVSFDREYLERLGGQLPPLEELLGWRLHALSAPYVWENRESRARVYTARCELGRLFRLLGEPHELPATPGCGCGFWGLPDSAAVSTLVSSGFTHLPVSLVVVGRVEMWGRYTRHERGWRAQHARPLDLTVLWRPFDEIDVTSFGSIGRSTEIAPGGWSKAEATRAASALGAYYRVPTAVGEFDRWLADRAA